MDIPSTLPTEIAELIIDHCDSQDTRTLLSCSLICKALHSHARFLLFQSRPVKLVDIPDIEAFVATIQHPLCTLHPHIHALSIHQCGSNLSILNHVVPALRSLSHLTDLEIVAKNALLSDQYQAILHASVHTLTLRMTFVTFADVVALVCSFPSLEILRLHGRWNNSPAVSPVLRLPRTLHTLELDGFLDTALSWLLSYPANHTLRSLQLRDVAAREIGVVFQYLKLIGTTLRHLQLSFLDNLAEHTFLTSSLDSIHTPSLHTLKIQGRNTSDISMVLHFLSCIRTSSLEEISFSSLVHHDAGAQPWAQLDVSLARPTYAALRQVSIFTHPSFQAGIISKLHRLHERQILCFVVPMNSGDM
ncbi:hypothetical protein C8J57DRAFT_596831 [Mycena rebaudengoi]|nr:hypothetical protein C8J57DRAFT_596831 [Mycena rebaudengoi]